MSRIQNPLSVGLFSPTPKPITRLVDADDIVNSIESAKIGVVSNPDRLSDLLGVTFNAIYNQH